MLVLLKVDTFGVTPFLETYKRRVYYFSNKTYNVLRVNILSKMVYVNDPHLNIMSKHKH